MTGNWKMEVVCCLRNTCGGCGKKVRVTILFRRYIYIHMYWRVGKLFRAQRPNYDSVLGVG